eukprot:COSAG01_NODE_11823_length_1852_cov_175.349686_4_plen_105_part_00
MPWVLARRDEVALSSADHRCMPRFRASVCHLRERAVLLRERVLLERPRARCTRPWLVKVVINGLGSAHVIGLRCCSGRGCGWLADGGQFVADSQSALIFGSQSC